MRTHLLHVICAAISTAAYAGDLDPPPGPVAPSMKTLDEVEPRTPINQATAPGDALALHVITVPGSYVLTGDTEVTGGRTGIRIEAENVTIDLNGFTLSAGIGAASGDGINGIGGSFTVVRNGRIVGFPGDGLSLGFSCVAEGVGVVFCGGTGILTASNAQLRDCLASNNGFRGINADVNAVISGCSANGNGDIGITTSFVANISGCVASDNTSNGFTVVSGSIRGCTANDNGEAGFSTNTDTLIESCLATDNASDGIVVQSDALVRGCSVTGNGFYGVRVIGTNNTIRNNRLSRNGFRPGPESDYGGIFVTSFTPLDPSHNTIDGNACLSDMRGIVVSTPGNTVTRNTVRNASVSAYDVAPSNDASPIRASFTGAGPWDNFGF